MSSLLRYSINDVWVKPLDQEQARIGITLRGLQRLGEIICMEWPLVGEYVKRDQPIGALESSKTVIDLYAPLDGWVVEINPRLRETVAAINEDPMGDGWIATLRMESPRQFEALLSEVEYHTSVGKEE